MEFVRNVENNSVALCLRKANLDADISSHTVLTDDLFTYVDFFFKTHKKIIKDSLGKPIEQNHIFYWQQAKNFYNASKILPIESAPLPMYYCMLNAVKAYLFYNEKNYEDLKKDFSGHGLKEGSQEKDSRELLLNDIYVRRNAWGVFCRFAKTEHDNFDSLWPQGECGAVSLKQLMFQLPFVHSAFISTYKLARKNEKFIPLAANQSPQFMYSKDNKIKLVVNLDRRYFKQSATTIPEEIKDAIPNELMVNESNPFQLVSKDYYKKREIQNHYNNLRKLFSYIAAEKRIWYLKKAKDEIENLNSMVLEIAIVHRFSEIVRYKPEQMVKLLSGKENWIVHEFLSLVLDQFIDEISCEITKRDIMPTRIK